MARCAAVLVFACAAVLAKSAVAAPAADIVTVGDTTLLLRQWLPQESYEGGAQHDPRLDRPVQAWEAGIPLRELFASIEEQTGVKLGFSSEGGQEERICVTLYLDPDEPPSLREVMAQLSWVTDCAFGYGLPGGERVYYLLTTSAVTGAMDELRDYAEERDLSRASGWVVTEMRERALAKLDEAEEALSLSEAELIRQYEGVDDLLLLALLDPPRRSLLEFLATAPRERLQREAGWARPWMDLAPEQRELLTAAFDPSLTSRLTQHTGKEPTAEEVERAWAQLMQRQPEFALNFNAGGQFFAALIPRTRSGTEDAEVPRLVLTSWVHLVWDPRTESAMTEGEMRDLKRLLGEEVMDPARMSEAEQMEWAKQRALLGLKSGIERHHRERAQLSEAAEELLRNSALSIREGAGYALWQVQEAVAASSGMHVISDCYWQPYREMSFRVRAIQPADPTNPSALAALKAACAATAGREGLWLWIDPRGWERAVGWEWGEAGRFLHFRSTERALWREAFLPAEAVEAIDSWLRPYPPEGESSAPLSVHLEPRACSYVIAMLSVAQARFGGRMIYGDPTGALNAYRHGFLQSVLDCIARLESCASDPPPPIIVYRFLASLNTRQWNRLCDEGLRWGEDVQGPASLGETRYRSELGYQKGDLLRIVYDAGPAPAWRHLTAATQWWRLQVLREGEEGPLPISSYLPTQISVRPKSTERLTELLESAASESE
jgi:hypothetical protein